MANTNVTKNYFAHGGNELVLGGRLTFLDGAEVVNFPRNLLAEAGGVFKEAGYLPDSTATTVAALREDFNALLARLRSAGIMEKNAPDGASAQDESGGAG